MISANTVIVAWVKIQIQISFIRKINLYVYGKCQYEVPKIKMLFGSKSISEEK